MTVLRVKSGSGQHGDGALELHALMFGHGRVEHLGFGEMAEDALQPDHRRSRDAGSERGKIVKRDAEARHAGIDLEVHVNLVVAGNGGSGGLEGFDLFGGGNGRSEAVDEQRFLFAAPETGHDEDGQSHAGLAHGDSLFGGGNAEPDGASVFEGARRFDDSVSIGVALDDAAGSHAGAEMAGDGAIVFRQRGERDFSPVGACVHGEFLLYG